MASGLPPRQRMINMMYLVLIALLALNVSREVLNAFVLINLELGKTTENFNSKNRKTYDNFEKAAAENPAKAGPWKNKAFAVKDRAEAMYQYAEDLKLELAMRIDKKDTREQVDLKTKEGVENKSDVDIPGEMFITDGRAAKLKEEINSFREFITSMIKPKDEKFKSTIAGSLNTSDPPVDAEGVKESWESENFEHLPAIAVITRMSQLQTSVRNAEAEVINYLEQEIEAGSLKFNKVEAIVIPEKTYVVEGDTFRADVFLAASDSLTPPSVLVGKYDAVDEGSYKMVGTADSLPVKAGKGKMSIRTTTSGMVDWGGVVSLQTLTGLKQYAFRSTYQVAKPSVNVSPDKMNVFYIGPENPVTVSAAGFPDDKIKPSISGGGGSIRKDPKRPGGYIVIVSSTGTAKVSVSGEMSPGEFKNLGSKDFRVKNVPPPIASFLGVEGDGKLEQNKLQLAQGVRAELKNFEFDLPFVVTSFDLSMTIGGAFVTLSSKTNRLTDEMIKYIKQASRGSKIYIESVQAKADVPGSKPLGIPGVNIKVI